MQKSHAFIFCLALLFTNVGQVDGQQRMSEHFNSKEFNAIANKNILSVMVKDTVQFRKTYGKRVTISRIHRPTNCVYLTIQDAQVLENLKTDKNILFVEIGRTPHTEGNYDFFNPSINNINQVRDAYPDLHGFGFNVSVKEESFDGADIDLKGRSFETAATPTAVSQHATSMAVLIGGAGNSSPKATGVADHLRLTSSDFNNLMPDDAALFINNNILIQNHSYGLGIENYYGIEAFAYDQQVSENPTLVHVFSSGNIGTSKPTAGPYKDLAFANLTGTFKQSKNVLVITAIDTALNVNPFNSRGPAYDGRLKPELTAYGPGGTSQSAALTTGAITLIQEKYKSKNNQTADVAMVKAILIATADDTGAKGIDFTTGYGNINVFKALNTVDADQVFEATLSQQSQISLPITIPQSIKQLKVAVTWIDPPATVSSEKALVNDIDAWIDNGTSIVRPWVLSSFPHVDSLNAPAKRKPDHLNTVEFITIEDPLPGTYPLIIKSGILNGTSQKISVAYSLTDVLDFSWTFPVASDILQGGGKNFLLWESQTNQLGDLYVQFNSGEWELIREQINLHVPFKWNTPNTLTKAKLKMVINGSESWSDEFVISPFMELTTAFNCADSLGLVWNKVSNATHYNVFAVGDQYLEPILATTDTTAAFNKPSFTHFVVAPMAGQTIGLKSGAINYVEQGVFCFLNFFNATRINSSEIKVEFSVSSFYNVGHINILKTVNGSETIFKTVSTRGSAFSYSDFISEGGVYVYQAQIIFTNGSTIFSDAKEIIIESPGKAIIWPNPVTPDDYLHIISEGNSIFRISNEIGEVVYEKELRLIEEEIDMESLGSGLYIYQLIGAHGITDVGRIIKW
jgi:Subtilase family